MPVGKTSVKTTFVAFALPLLRNAIVYVTVEPGGDATDLTPLTSLSIAFPLGPTITAEPPTTVGSLAVGVLLAPPPLADAVFVTPGTADGKTLTSSVIGDAFAPAAIAIVDEHVTA
jgi:hypothetical protein